MDVAALAERFAYPCTLPRTIRVFDVGGSGVKTKRFALSSVGNVGVFAQHADFLPHLEPDLPAKGQSQMGKYCPHTEKSPMEWVRRHLDNEAAQAGAACDSETTVYALSNGFLCRVGLEHYWSSNFRQDRLFPHGLPIVDPSNNMDGTGGIDDTLAHFYDAQLRVTAGEYPLLNVACGTFAVILYAETPTSMPTRSPKLVAAGRRLHRYVDQLSGSTLGSAAAADVRAEFEAAGRQVAEQIFRALSETLREIAAGEAWSREVVVDSTCQLNYPELARIPKGKRDKDPGASRIIKTFVFSGGVAQGLDIARRAEEWWQSHGRAMPGADPELTFTMGDKDAPHTGTAAYALDHIVHPNPEQRVFKPKFPNGMY